MDKQKLIIVIPAYNEEENIAATLNQWYPVVERIGNNSRLVILNDGSKDNTAAILNSHTSSHPQLQVIDKPNSGHGATLLAGYHYAIGQQAGFVFQTDSDGQTDPNEFWDFWELRNSFDVIIGDRSKRQDGISRVVVTNVLKFVVKRYFGVLSEDANCPFRLMRTDCLADQLPLIPNDYNLTNVALTAAFHKKGCAVKYMPVTFRPRQGGTNSINLPRIIGIGKKALDDFKAINKTIEAS